MKVLKAIGLLLVVIWAQTWVLPAFFGQRALPDLFLLSAILIGFLSSATAGIGGGFVLGLIQGMIQGSSALPFAVSRSFAGGFASWLKNRWLWSGLPSCLVAVALATVSAELLHSFLITLAFRDTGYLIASLPIGLAETVWSCLLVPFLLPSLWKEVV